MIDSEFERKGREMSEKELNDAKLTLATLCDMVLGEDAKDRSDDALVRAVGEMKRERDELQKNLSSTEAFYVAAKKRTSELEHERDAAQAKLAEYEGENKRWHSFETVQAIVQEREQLRARIAELESERATLRLSLNTTNVIVNDQIGKIADLIKERDAANRQLEFFRNQFPTAARNWDRVNGASDSGDGVGDEGWQYYISSQ